MCLEEINYSIYNSGLFIMQSNQIGRFRYNYNSCFLNKEINERS